MNIESAAQEESALFKTFFKWLKEHMPPAFFQECKDKELLVITRSLLGFEAQNRFILIHFEEATFGITLDLPGSDLRILKELDDFTINSYRTFHANAPLPGQKEALPHIKIAIIRQKCVKECGDIEKKAQEVLLESKLSQSSSSIVSAMDRRFISMLSEKRLATIIDLIQEAKKSDLGQITALTCSVSKDPHLPCLQILAVYKDPPQIQFLERIAESLLRYDLQIKRIGTSHFTLESTKMLALSLGLSPISDKEPTQDSIQALCDELATLKQFDEKGILAHFFIQEEKISAKKARLLEALGVYTHQMLLHTDLNLYSKEHIEEAFTGYPTFILEMLDLFDLRLHPKNHNPAKASLLENDLLARIGKIDTGNLILDRRRKTILQMSVHCIQAILKTNYFCSQAAAIAFRIDPLILTKIAHLPPEKFPEMPYGIFLITNSHFISYNIRFKDLSRGGLRTILPQKPGQALWEQNNLFQEAYNLAYTQQKKNKDIPEGGAKSVILINPFLWLDAKNADMESRWNLLLSCQRVFITSLMDLINCGRDGKLLDSHVLDLFGKPEYLYLGPDENMTNSMIEWIADYSVKVKYPVGTAFISSKPKTGINHKEYGVTSLGVNVYAEKILKYMGIDPKSTPFTVKMSGGPDGDVAGNEIVNLFKHYPKTAKLLALTDGSGTIYDPKGLDLEQLVSFFHNAEAIHHYPPEKLSEGGFLLDLKTQVQEEPYVQKKVLYKKESGKVVRHLISSDEAQKLFNKNVHSVQTDLFIPAGGRPKTLNEFNVHDFLNEEGKPTAKAIVEGANLYLTDKARTFLEERGTLIVKDSSANKCGVICSSMEVVLSLLLSEKEFITQKTEIMKEVLEYLRKKAALEADLLISTHEATQMPMTVISEMISEKINKYTYELLEDLEKRAFPEAYKKATLHYFIPYIQRHAADKIFTNIPDIHIKAIFASMCGSWIIYQRGLFWEPHLIEVLPQLLEKESL